MLYFQDIDIMTKLLVLNLVFIAINVALGFIKGERKLVRKTTMVYLLGIIIATICWIANAVAIINEHVAHGTTDTSLQQPAPWQYNTLLLMSMAIYIIGLVVEKVKSASHKAQASIDDYQRAEAGR